MAEPLPDLPTLCAYWQGVLGLADWEIAISCVRASKMRCDGAAGSCSPIIKTRRAIIEILDPDDYPDAPSFPFDIEQVLVHELLHCHHHRTEIGTVEDLLEEQGVEATSRALVRLRRAVPESEPEPAKRSRR